MFKALIVDDEFMIRQGLKKIIEWEEYGAQIIGEASNGKEALEIISTNKPSIIITDIKMPFMDGIELIKQIRDLKLNIRIVVLSGYDDFKLVKNAMRYGAENYLLKPVDTDELRLAIRDIVEDLNRNILYEIQNREGILQLKNSTLNRLVKNEISVMELGQKMDLLELDLSGTNFCVAVISPSLKLKSDDKTVYWLNYAILNICDEIVSNKYNSIAFTDITSNVVLIFKNCENNHEHICSVLMKCIQSINSACRVDVNCLVGSIVPTYRDVHLSYEQALEGIKYKIVCGFNKVIVSSEMHDLFEKKQAKFTVKFDLIKQSVITMKKVQFNEYIEEFMDKHEFASPEQIRNFTIRVIIEIINVMTDLKMDKNIVLNMYDCALFDIVSNADDINTLKDLVLDVGSKAIDLLSEKHNVKYSRVITKVVKHIEDNYSDQGISLKTLASEMEVSPTYLGRVFKAETGEYFSDYINKIRVKKAKDLILNTDNIINDISAMVGFNNNAYFYTIFKKYTGINPGSLRNV